MLEARTRKVVMLPQCSFLSEVSRALQIAGALRKRGVQVVFASRGGTYAHLIGEAGYPVRRLDPAASPETEQRFLQAILSMGPFTSRDFYTNDELRTAVDAEVALLREESPDLVVTGFTLSAYVSTKVARVPLATDHAGSFVPPVLARGLCPIPVNPPDDLARLPKPVQRFLANRVPALLKGPVKQLNRHARARGVEPLAGLMGMMCGDLTLVTELPEILDLPSDELQAPRRFRSWGPRVTTTYRFTGPLFARLEIPVPPEVDAFLDGSQRVVYVAPTSVDESFLRTLVLGARGSGVRVLVAAGPHDINDLATDDVLVTGVLPNHLVMPRVDAAVIMGGQGSVQTAMASGTPFIGLPYHGEQELNVAVAERLGMAIRMKPADAHTPALSNALRSLLTDPDYATAARRAAAVYAPVDGAELAAQAIIDWLDSRTHRQAAPVA